MTSESIKEYIKRTEKDKKKWKSDILNNDPELINDEYKRKYISRLLDGANSHLENSWNPENREYIEASLDKATRMIKGALCMLNSDELDKYDPEICRHSKETYVYKK